MEKYDVIIVGAGPAGIACAYTLAKAGIEAVVFERGDHPGAKNLIGGILFTSTLSKIIPDFLRDAPLERYIKERKFSLLSTDTELSFSFKTEKFSKPPHNNSFTVFRAKFDNWFARKAEEIGAMVLSKVTVDELIWKNKKCVGVKTRLDEGELYADVVVLAEGANSVLAEKEGLKNISSEKHMAVAVKEIISLPQEVIEERFHITKNSGDENIPEGVAIEFFGDAIQGLFGNGFIYTNKDSLSVGIGCTMEGLSKNNLNPNDLLEYFKNHPCVSNLIRDGKTVEYSAHMIPEGGFNSLPDVVFDGGMLVGDCAGLLNTSFFHEGTNLAMASGMYAAETIIEAKRDRDFSYRSLLRYEHKLKKSFVIEDMKKFRNFPALGDNSPEILNKYPDVLAQIITEYFTVGDKSKKRIEIEIVKKFFNNFGTVKPVNDFKNLVRAMGWI
jgi:electron transfer flavoprotein-quinone oxidoreductase